MHGTATAVLCLQRGRVPRGDAGLPDPTVQHVRWHTVSGSTLQMDAIQKRYSSSRRKFSTKLRKIDIVFTVHTKCKTYQNAWKKYHSIIVTQFLACFYGSSVLWNTADRRDSIHYCSLHLSKRSFSLTTHCWKRGCFLHLSTKFGESFFGILFWKSTSNFSFRITNAMRWHPSLTFFLRISSVFYSTSI